MSSEQCITKQSSTAHCVGWIAFPQLRCSKSAAVCGVIRIGETVHLLKVIFFFMLCNIAYSEEIQVWPTKADMERIKKIDWNDWGKYGFYDHPCGPIKLITVSELPPPDSENYIEGTEKVYEFNRAGEIINQWAMPVDSYLFAVSHDNIIVRKGNGAISISRSGRITKIIQPPVQAEQYTCPQTIKQMFIQSSFARCSKHTDIKDNKPRYFVYEGVCT